MSVKVAKFEVKRLFVRIFDCASFATFLFLPHFDVLCDLFLISINLLVVYRESVNLIGYITRRLSADSLQL